MTHVMSDVIQGAVRDLIRQITHLEESGDRFQALQRRMLTLTKSDTMYFLTVKDIETAVSSMGDKFVFHGFSKHAEYLKKTHDRYVDRNIAEPDLTPRLHIVKFLLCMSQSPTNRFWQNPEEFEFIYASDDEQQPVEDWGAYLNEGIERWSPVKDDSFCERSDSDESTDRGSEPPKEAPRRPVIIKETRNYEVYDFKACRKELLEKVQNGWYNGGTVCMEPPSDWFDARVGMLYEQHLQKQAHGLIQIEPITVISEYKVMREILWQMWGPHSSVVFEFKIDRLVARPNVTISSVCAITFERFMDVFIPYIELLDDFRQFSKSLSGDDVSETYRTYGYGVEKILRGVFQELLAIETEVMEQETTMTLLILANKFHQIFEPAHVLKGVHLECVLEDFRERSPLECALTLLTRLRKHLQFCVTKMEQDIVITLYLQCLFYYLAMTNAWFVKNDLFDHTEEFVISNQNTRSSAPSKDYRMNFVLRENVDEFCRQDALIGIISDEVLQIGRNIHLLRLLGKYDVFAKGSNTIHEEFVERFVAELAKYYDVVLETNDASQPQEPVQRAVSSFDINGMGDWTNFVDLSDGFLAKAFEGFYAERADEKKTEDPLFEKISKITTNFFPLRNLPEKILEQILKERFTISGLMVKNLLIDNYNLDKQFDFLNHMFLFWDDLIFPFYRRLFENMNTANSNWGNSVWLTSHLQDIIMDHYPNFYESCFVSVAEFWKQCRDSLEACTLIDIRYEIKWPLSIIITNEHVVMYKELFQFILRIKWALYTVNHLAFTDLEPKSESRKPQTSRRLKCLRFNLINILNSIQHYVFGYIFAKFKIQFELDFEKSNDLRSLIGSHENFIRNIHRVIVEIRDRKRKEHGFQTMLKCVKMLKVMWNGFAYATGENLDSCHKIYKASFSVVNEIVNPVLLLDYY